MSGRLSNSTFARRGRHVSPTDLQRGLASSGLLLVSTDIFDTVLMRDASTETQRLAASSRRAAARLGVDPDALTRLRWDCQTAAYRAVAVERPDGDASLSKITAAMAALLGMNSEAADVLRETEVDTDIRHLHANRAVLSALQKAADRGIRVVAVSDTYYCASDLAQMIEKVVGPSPIEAVYSSSDLGVTKHAGGIFDEVSKREGMGGECILHIGDSSHSDVDMAERSGWNAVHIPRSAAYRVAKRAGQLRSIALHARRAR